MIDLEIFTVVLKELGYLDGSDDEGEKDTSKKHSCDSKDDREENDGDS